MSARFENLEKCKNPMIAIFQDLEDKHNKADGLGITDVGSLDALLRSFEDRGPFFFELRAENDTMLTVGWSRDLACAQYSPSDGQPPYLMALGDPTADPDSYLEFLAGGTPTPISRRFCMPIANAREIVVDFLQHGQRSSTAEWEEI